MLDMMEDYRNVGLCVNASFFELSEMFSTFSTWDCTNSSSASNLSSFGQEKWQYGLSYAIQI
jgi:hypothetical protein